MIVYCNGTVGVLIFIITEVDFFYSVEKQTLGKLVELGLGLTSGKTKRWFLHACVVNIYIFENFVFKWQVSSFR